ncbi:hypothetical protein MTsPCn5_29970 [Croceitalea sp. MTPC5]|uniref:DoxX family membrane protein n=1 Tax=Croceitalea sp. MTPC5 TaxID=3056565 RepID=UPI002B3F0998|nr:hypothetical protein MTsPCn5_29970 [Croceitalea sp. MTPC5]
MNSKVFFVIRILLGLMVLVFGLNKFLQFIPPFELNEAGQNYFMALTSTQTMTMVAVVEIAAGIALITNKFGALMSVILMSVSVNAVLFHATLAPEGIAPALGLLLLNILVLVGYKSRYEGMLKA